MKTPLRVVLFAMLFVSLAISRAADTQLPPLNIDDDNPHLPDKFI